MNEMKMERTRVFLAHPKGIEGVELADMKLKVQVALGLAGYEDVKLMTGKDDYDRRFKSSGSWEAWGREVALGVDPISRSQNYHLFVVAPGRQVGAATKQIVELALTAGKTCAFWDGERFRKIRRIAFLGDTKNFKTGWEVVV